jgi:hypothetical protein
VIKPSSQPVMLLASALYTWDGVLMVCTANNSFNFCPLQKFRGVNVYPSKIYFLKFANRLFCCTTVAVVNQCLKVRVQIPGCSQLVTASNLRNRTERFIQI